MEKYTKIKLTEEQANLAGYEKGTEVEVPMRESRDNWESFKLLCEETNKGIHKLNFFEITLKGRTYPIVMVNEADSLVRDIDITDSEVVFNIKNGDIVVYDLMFKNYTILKGRLVIDLDHDIQLWMGIK